ncbi:MAG: extracellular solute-binding protein [Clostridia bacterium]|nr:extracellular solute-binding protein [Lachnospiraceae bacterium]NCC00988.1 extracellular solute-binding protein [Clostridia bacterium]NCD03440.1 extracellular solute-binding protein [Clostridia bacterium]
MQKKNIEIKVIFAAVTVLFVLFLMLPMIGILGKSFMENSGVGLSHYIDVLTAPRFAGAFRNSILISLTGAVITTALAFMMAYTINFTNVPKMVKKFIRAAAVLPMLLPTITYGFAIIYSFGKQGLITRIFGGQLFNIYGFNGLLMGYIIYTLPISFMLINNTMGYIDKKFLLVSRVMGDSPLQTFMTAVLRPLWGTLAASMIQCFFLSFTDFGIPASVGGKVDVVAGILYEEMLGSIPNFNNGAVVAVMMLLPSVISITVLHILEKYNVRYNKISSVELKKNKGRDALLGILSVASLVAVLSVFAVIVIVPFVSEWPYRMSFTLDNVRAVFDDSALVRVYTNSLYVALVTAVAGSLVVYGAALVTARSKINQKCKKVIESIALVTNTIPGMVLGIAFMLSFTGTSLQNTFVIIIVCNVIHFFSTPYLMMKNSLEKMNASWETTARLMGDTWVKTVIRVVTPNAAATILEVFSYYFVNAMVTVSAIIFIAGARTMVITAKIKELQHFAKFNEIFILSLFILVTNLVAKGIFGFLVNKKTNESKQPVRGGKIKMKRTVKGALSALLVGTMLVTSTILTGCSSSPKTGSESEVVLYSNADDEAIEAMKNALDGNGYEGKYIIQTFGTSELGGKLLAEGKNIEADLVTMSSFYLESAQGANTMFKELSFDTGALETYPGYYTPITAQEGAIIVNTEMMAENNLPMPTSIKDLANPEYKGFLSVTDIKSSSTAWLLIQALVSEYGEDEAKEILTKIYENAGDHIEESGSGPIKKVRAGEVAVGFGLRHQAVADKADGLPIDFVDPTEGNFTLTESVAVIDKGDKTNPLAMEMAECIIKNGRKELLATYPVPLYDGETVDEANASGNPKKFAEPLTAELMKEHQELSESCK